MTVEYTKEEWAAVHALLAERGHAAMAQRDEAYKEVHRLRAALERIANQSYEMRGTGREIAREALAGLPKSGKE